MKLPLLLALLVTAVPATAQTYSVIHNFGAGTPANDGQNPCVTLITALDGNYYGLTTSGGTAGKGTVFKMTPTGSVTIVHNFADGSVTNDGFNPTSLIQTSDGTFYGTTAQGGTYYPSDGAVFKITPQGVYSILHAFQDGTIPGEGSGPNALVEGTDGNLYGTTANGGTNNGNNGTFFRLTTAGKPTELYSFLPGDTGNDGIAPSGSLVEGPDGNFYGTTFAGTGTLSDGMIYSMSPSGARTVVSAFGFDSGLLRPIGLLAASDGNMYGMTEAGGPYSCGAIYRLASLTTVSVVYNFGTNSTLDGADAAGNVLLAPDGNFYGACEEIYSGGGKGGTGLVFKVTPQGQMTVLHEFTVGYANDGNQPTTGIVQGPDGNLYGTTAYGGTGREGVVYEEALGLHAPAPVITGLLSRVGTAGLPFPPYYVIASSSPSSYAATNLPPGLSISAGTGIISGVPNTEGIYKVNVSATNGGGTTSTVLTITILRSADTPVMPPWGLAMLAGLLAIAAIFKPRQTA